MLAAAPSLRSTAGERDEGEMDGFPATGSSEIGLSDLGSGDFLFSFDFDDVCISIDDGDALPDLEMDPLEAFRDFSGSAGDTHICAGDESPDAGKSERVDGEADGMGLDYSAGKVEEAVKRSSRDLPAAADPSLKEETARKSWRKPKKRKVDWTAELHRRFVEAVEQLGVEKAVPSRILDLMRTDSLTRHNIASHLQKYRSHRKHLLVREAEAASWSCGQLWQRYGGGGEGRGGGPRGHLNPCLAPTMAFPPVHPFRPLHVWGHPSLHHSLLHICPTKLLSPPPTWPPPPPATSFWRHPQPHPHPHYRDPLGWMPLPGAPCFPQPLPLSRCSSGVAVAAGMPPVAPAYGPGVGAAVPSAPHPSNESIEAAIGDAISNPRLPLPLGLKPPSMESVLVELERQGIPKVPPSAATT